ncbi:unnamed protein product, partial [Effrenium voratum]
MRRGARRALRALLNALLLGSLPDLFLGGVSPARPNAKAEAKEVRLLDEEGSWIFLLLRGMTTVSFCQGELPITWLRDRLARLLAANPWLGGRLVRKSEAVYLSFGCEADERHLQLLGPDVIQITADMPYELISQQVSGSRAEVRSGMDCLQNPREPLIRVSLCCEAGDRFALIVSLSHIIADGYTYHRLFHMLTNRSVPVVALNPCRKLEFHERRLKALGRKEYEFIYSPQYVLNCLMSKVFFGKPKCRAYLVDPEKVKQAKAREGAAFVSTNDILTSMFANAVGARVCSMAVNFRGRLPGLTEA